MVARFVQMAHVRNNANAFQCVYSQLFDGICVVTDCHGLQLPCVHKI